MGERGRMSYQTDRAWSDQWIPKIREIVGPYLLEPSSFEVDTKQAADLVVLTARDLTVACRVRRKGYAATYGKQFTIRSHRDSGATTEYEKILLGWGDWLFYGHETMDGKGIFPWMIVNLKAWRYHLLRERRPNEQKLIHGEMPNGDGTYFRWFDATSFPDEHPILIAQRGVLPPKIVPFPNIQQQALA